MTEEELAEKFMKIFEGFDIYQEVPCAGRVVDFVSKNGTIVTAIEVKKSLNWDVINQAFENTRYFHYSYIAVPYPKSIHSVQKMILKEYGIGLLTYLEHSKARSWKAQRENPDGPLYIKEDHVEEIITPRFFRKVVVPKLMEFMKDNVAGTQHGRITPFGYFIRCIKEVLLKERKPISYQKLFEELEYRYYPKLTSFKNNIYQYIRAGIITGVEWNDGGLLSLTKEEEEALLKEGFKRPIRKSFITNPAGE